MWQNRAMLILNIIPLSTLFDHTPKIARYKHGSNRRPSISPIETALEPLLHQVVNESFRHPSARFLLLVIPVNRTPGHKPKLS